MKGALGDGITFVPKSSIRACGRGLAFVRGSELIDSANHAVPLASGSEAARSVATYVREISATAGLPTVYETEDARFGLFAQYKVLAHPP